MSDYLSLHNLQLGESPFSVERIIDSGLVSSPECQLPTDNPLSLILPTIDVTLPSLECKFDIVTPLIPLPDFCLPSVSGSITINTSGDLAMTVVTPISVSPEAGSDCNFQLQGEVDLCVPMYMATMEPTHYNSCHEPDEWTIRVSGSCDGCVTKDGTDGCLSGSVVGNDFLVVVPYGTYYVTFSCCDSSYTVGPMIAPEPTTSCPSIDCSDVAIDVEGTFNGVPITVNFVEGASYDEFAGDSLMDLNADVTSDDSYPDCQQHLSFNPDLTLYLPQLEFSCDPTVIEQYYTKIDAQFHRLDIGADVDRGSSGLGFNSACCSNTYAYWVNCGSKLSVGSAYDTVITIDTADLGGANKVAQFREMTICVDGVSKSFWVLATEPEEV